MATKDMKGLREGTTQEATDRLEALSKSAGKKGLQIHTKILRGKPFLEIIREVLRNGHDLVIVSPALHGKLESIFSGSTTMHLMRKCPCPVWAVKPSKKEQYHRILAAVDPAPVHSDHLKLARKIMELAVSLAEAEGAELHVLHCWSSSFEKTLRNRSGLLPSEADEIVRKIRTSHKSSLNSLVKEFDLEHVPHKIHLLKGEPEHVIVETAAKKRTELVVMGTVSRKGLSGFLIGNTAEKGLNQLACSVLAVKPDGFVSIVSLDE